MGVWCFGIRSLQSRECGLYKAADLILGDHCVKSVSTQWLDATWPHKRKRRLMNHEKLRKLQKSNTQLTEIFEPNLIDNYYPQQCKELHTVCLYDLVRYHKRVGRNENGHYTYSKLTKPCLLTTECSIQPRKMRGRILTTLSLLFVPFQKEADLLGTTETAEEAFKRHLQPGSGLNFHHDKLQPVLLAQTKVREIN